MLRLLNSGNNVRVAQVNTQLTSLVFWNAKQKLNAMQAANESNGYSDFVLMITYIVSTQTQKYWLCAYMDTRSSAFNFKLENNHAFLAGAVSRVRNKWYLN